MFTVFEALEEKAKAICQAEFDGIFYGEYKYYDYHLLNVYNRVNDFDLEPLLKLKCKIVAIMHDLLEDTEYSEDKLRFEFGDEIADAVVAITYYKGNETREEYYLRILENEIATIVKRADASENKYNCQLSGDTKREKYYDKIVKRMS